MAVVNKKNSVHLKRALIIGLPLTALLVGATGLTATATLKKFRNGASEQNQILNANIDLKGPSHEKTGQTPSDHCEVKAQRRTRKMRSVGQAQILSFEISEELNSKVTKFIHESQKMPTLYEKSFNPVYKWRDVTSNYQGAPETQEAAQVLSKMISGLLKTHTMDSSQQQEDVIKDIITEQSSELINRWNALAESQIKFHCAIDKFVKQKKGYREPSEHGQLPFRHWDAQIGSSNTSSQLCIFNSATPNNVAVLGETLNQRQEMGSIIGFENNDSEKQELTAIYERHNEVYDKYVAKTRQKADSVLQKHLNDRIKPHDLAATVRSILDVSFIYLSWELFKYSHRRIVYCQYLAYIMEKLLLDLVHTSEKNKSRYNLNHSSLHGWAQKNLENQTRGLLKHAKSFGGLDFRAVSESLERVSQTEEWSCLQDVGKLGRTVQDLKTEKQGDVMYPVYKDRDSPTEHQINQLETTIRTYVEILEYFKKYDGINKVALDKSERLVWGAVKLQIVHSGAVNAITMWFKEYGDGTGIQAD